jgi:hemolysin III
MEWEWFRERLRDPVCSMTHLFWCGWSVFAAVLLWRLARGDRLRQLSVGCFGLSMVLLYLASGVYHALKVEEPILKYFRLLDHSAIYVLIAGTYTPVFAVLLKGPLRTWLLGTMWGLVVVGITCKWTFSAPPYWVTVGLYLSVGWIGMIPIFPMTRAVGLRGMACGLFGGLFYTIGAVCDVVNWPVIYPGIVSSHEVVHLCDMGGTFTHVVFVIRYVLPFRH